MRTSDTFHYNIRFNSIETIQIDSMPKLILVHFYSKANESALKWTVISTKADRKAFYSKDPPLFVIICFKPHGSANFTQLMLMKEIFSSIEF